MRRKLWSVIVLVVGLSASALPASAATCDDMLALARLNASGAGTATGSAVVFWNGGVQIVGIDSAINGPVVDQTWHFGADEVQVVETPHPVFLPGPRQIIDSDVVVVSPDNGMWEYNGIFNESTLTARFVVTGELCIA